jgi:replication initiation and membrane attachment protein DnaB
VEFLDNYEEPFCGSFSLSLHKYVKSYDIIHLGDHMKRKVYIYQKDMTDELKLFFEGINENYQIESFENDIITIVDEDYYNEEPVDLESFHMLLVEDFDSLVTIIIEPYQDGTFPLGEQLKSFIQVLPHGVYHFEEVITYVVLKNHEPLKKAIKSYIASKVNTEVIHTVRQFIENNMNSSLSAKKLYMHRNTLNYRVDNFIESTHINVKNFTGANAVYMLYKF